MMSATPLELDYIGLSKTSASESYSCLKTELSLSLPGSQSPGSLNPDLELSLFGQETPANGYAFNSDGMGKDFSGRGGKRGFADSSGKWGLAINDGSEGEVGKGAALFSQGAGKGLSVLEIGKKPGQRKDMDIDVGIASHKSLKHVNGPGSVPPAKAEVVGWPPIRAFRKNSMASASTKNSNEADEKSGSTCLFVKVSMDGAPYLRKVDLKLYKNYRELSLALKTMFSCSPVSNGKDGLSNSHLHDLLQGSECVLTYEDKDGDWMLVGDVPWDMFIGTCKRLRIMKGSEATGIGKS